MIAYALIDDLFDAARTALNLTFIRANQTGKKPAYPYATYNILSQEGENLAQRARTTEATANADNAIIKESEKFKVPVSIAFYDKEPDTIFTKAADLRKWLTSAGKDFLFTHGMTLRFLSAVINQSALLDSYYECRVGFDIRLDKNVTNSVTIEAIRTVQINPDSGGSNIAT
jgi:hypothetical protein